MNVAVDYRNKVIKRNSITNFKAVSGTFEYYWTNYINYCKNDVKMAFTTLKSKRIVYNTYCKKIKNNKIDKISKEYLFNYIDNLKTTNIEKNLIIKELRAFFNCKWE